MHAAAFRALALDHTYEALRVSSDELADTVARLRAGQFDGLNVTVPHKVRVLELVDEVAPSASVGAANTLVRDARGRVVAHNTDVLALALEIAALGPRAHASRALVLGAGGAGRAAVAALRNELRVGEVIVRKRPLSPDPEVERDVAIVVQATSCGMAGADPGAIAADAVAWDALPSDAVAIDVVYAAGETPFLAAARARGLRATDGLGMLARQGALALELWLGRRAPLDAMRSAIE
jgi:shikimate dehydrogenase